MPHYQTDGSCCCGGGDCCPATGSVVGCTGCADTYTFQLPSVFTDECACWNGESVFLEQATNISLEPYCIWDNFTTQTLPCPEGIETIGGYMECDSVECEWVVQIFIGTQGLYPCSEIIIEARIANTDGCPPTGDWPITSWTWGSGSATGCSPCTEIDLSGEVVTVS